MCVFVSERADGRTGVVQAGKQAGRRGASLCEQRTVRVCASVRLTPCLAAGCPTEFVTRRCSHARRARADEVGLTGGPRTSGREVHRGREVAGPNQANPTGLALAVCLPFSAQVVVVEEEKTNDGLDGVGRRGGWQSLGGRSAGIPRSPCLESELALASSDWPLFFAVRAGTLRREIGFGRGGDATRTK